MDYYSMSMFCSDVTTSCDSDNPEWCAQVTLCLFLRTPRDTLPGWTRVFSAAGRTAHVSAPVSLSQLKLWHWVFKRVPTNIAVFAVTEPRKTAKTYKGVKVLRHRACITTLFTLCQMLGCLRLPQEDRRLAVCDLRDKSGKNGESPSGEVQLSWRPGWPGWSGPALTAEIRRRKMSWFRLTRASSAVPFSPQTPNTPFPRPIPPSSPPWHYSHAARLITGVSVC